MVNHIEIKLYFKTNDAFLSTLHPNCYHNWDLSKTQDPVVHWKHLGVIGLQPVGRLKNRLSFGVFGAMEARGYCRIFCPFAFFLPLLLSIGSFSCFDISWRLKLLDDPKFFPHTLQACCWRCLFKLACFG